ncbi:uncharacterized protein MYCGRDRAFT_110020 [Zymoseptoria tritici IPO323]|uniref:Uncharacterized protein n=1 Tax=Zymoseptoria tritici (strain CBS 115943 / IPO323) TaxID=336722 RepID=F9XEH9_ZYMTI|nr:uncharacterized protein MYCGRDRAFT_110020 [Zymoseptoria tritici IPO323]EGP86628.1 hypothetical protein MYCGRDRAFT_110020 [Zymoseptoria tritici IPO323]
MPDSATIAASTAGPIRRMQHSSLYNRVARPVVAPLSLIEDYDEAYASANPGELPPRLYERVTRRERQLTYKPGQKITFMTLPPEIHLKLPRSLRVPGIFTEAISFFFANTPVSMAFRSNCSRAFCAATCAFQSKRCDSAS